MLIIVVLYGAYFCSEFSYSHNLFFHFLSAINKAIIQSQILRANEENEDNLWGEPMNIAGYDVIVKSLENGV